MHFPNMDQPDPRNFITQSLKLRRRSEWTWDVLCCGILVGHLHDTRRNNGKKQHRWEWRLHGPKAEGGHWQYGGAPSKLDAKHAFRMAFDKWLTFAVFEAQKPGKKRRYWMGWRVDE